MSTSSKGPKPKDSGSSDESSLSSIASLRSLGYNNPPSSFNQNADSTRGLVQPPPPALIRRSSWTSITTESENHGNTRRPTPTKEEADCNSLNSNARSSTLKSVTDFGRYVGPQSYRIETVDKYDDIEFLPLWKRRLYRLSPSFTLFAVAAYFLYYAFRIQCTIYAQRAYHEIYIMAWTFIAAEGCVACMRQSYFWYLISLITRRPCPLTSCISNALHTWPVSSKVAPPR